jgi:hypothetical protein
VLQVDAASDPDSSLFIRTPLNLIRKDWNHSGQVTTGLVSGNLPSRISRIVAYLWIIDKKEIDLQLNSFSLFQLHGEGVQKISKAKI